MNLLERTAQLEALEAAVTQAAGRRGSVVLVSGEPGIGKTALVSGFAAGLEHRVLWGTCDDLTVPRPLAALTDLAGQVWDELRVALQGGGPPATVLPLMLAELSRLSPTVLVLEDLHWADEATLDVPEHHVSAVLAKLAVPSRRHAVRRAAELGILNRT